MRKLRLVATLAVMGTLLVGCKPLVQGEHGQGVTDTKILIGNTAATSGAFAGVGLPFNAGLNARLDVLNAAGGYKGRKVELKHYDDGFVGTAGYTYTEKLVEDDKVFALVGHFGTPTVSATVDYIQDKGVPMVYAATGINDLYFQKTPGNPVLAVQPIYKTEGRVMVARVFGHADLFGAVAKLGVVYTTDDAGQSIMNGINQQLLAMGKDTSTTKIALDAAAADYNAAADSLKAAGVNAVIVAANQAPYTKFLNAMKDRELEVPVYTSYVSASVAAIPNGFATAKRKIFANAWVDLYTEDGQKGLTDYMAAVNAAKEHGAITEAEHGYAMGAGIAFGIAGYIAGDVFVQGLERLGDKAISWENYIAALEEAPIALPMAAGIDFSEGKRWGIDKLLLLQRDESDVSGFVLAKTGATIDELVA